MNVSITSPSPENVVDVSISTQANYVDITSPNPANIIDITPPNGGNVVQIYAGIAGPTGPQGPQGNPGSDANVTEANITAALGYTPIGDAPNDGNQYARQDLGWTQIQSGNPFNQSLNTTNDVVFNSVAAGSGFSSSKDDGAGSSGSASVVSTTTGGNASFYGASPSSPSTGSAGIGTDGVISSVSLVASESASNASASMSCTTINSNVSLSCSLGANAELYANSVDSGLILNGNTISGNSTNLLYNGNPLSSVGLSVALAIALG